MILVFGNNIIAQMVYNRGWFIPCY